MLAFKCHNPSQFHCTFWYSSEAFEALGFDISGSSNSEASFSSSARGLNPPCFLACVFFCLFALGGVDERRDASCCEPFTGLELSSSVSGFDRFFDAAGLAFGLSVVCAVFFGAAFAGAVFVAGFVAGFVATFFGTAFAAVFGLALGFYSSC